ncbi:hypothetical protein BGX30_014980 [Mortierella sp. GBA39]|nr:hypothetical protein BGX30_014980 [Mortierella sp. GBA39]
MDIDDFPNDLQLDDAAFEQFDDYDAFADEMMEIAEKADQQQQQKQQQASSTVTPPSQSSVSSASASAIRASSSGIGALPAQRDYLAMLNAQTQLVEQEVAQSQQQRAAAATGTATATWKGAATKKGGSGGGGWNKPIGSTSGNAGAPVEGDLATVNVAKKRAKVVRLDSEKLLGIQGFPMLMAQGKRFKIRNKHRTSAEKDANSKRNLADLMILYQTWAHNLFPKSTFRDFILQTEAKCKSDKQIKASMNGWRDAYWDEVREKLNGVDGSERAAMAAEDRMNGVWEQHTAGRAQGATESMEQDPFLDAEKGDGQPSSSTWSFGNEDTTFTTTGNSSGRSKPAQSRERPAAASRKGKERLVDNSSTAMRLQISDNEDDGSQDDYEVALSRMRDSMNLNSRSPVVQRTTSRFQDRSRSGAEAMGEDRQPSLRISGSGMSRAGSIFDEEEEGDDEAPLFTHRALQMIGGLSALEERQRAAAAEKESNGSTSNIPGKKTPASTQRATLPSDEEEEENVNNNTLDQVDPSPVNLSLGSQWGFGSGESMFGEFKNAGSGVTVKGESGLNLDDDEDEEEVAVISQRRPKARKALILEDSDDE